MITRTFVIAWRCFDALLYIYICLLRRVSADEQTVDPDADVTAYGIHALRMLWKSTTQLGCSISSCMYYSTDVEVLVCNYAPP